MGNLYKINVLHASPKDSHTSTQGYVVLTNDEDVYKYIDEKFNYGGWLDTEEEQEEPLEIYDEDYKVIGHESYKERIIRLNGNIDDEDVDFSDAYYGITLWGWKDMGPISEDEIKVLSKFGAILNSDGENNG